jgi:hypothetical protein
MNDLTVVLFSQNSISNYETAYNKRISGKVNIPEVISSDPDIIVEMTQEDSRINLGSILEKPSENYNKIKISLNSLGFIDKNIIMQLYYKNKFQNDIQKSYQKGTIALK